MQQEHVNFVFAFCYSCRSISLKKIAEGCRKFSCCSLLNIVDLFKYFFFKNYSVYTDCTSRFIQCRLESNLYIVFRVARLPSMLVWNVTTCLWFKFSYLLTLSGSHYMANFWSPTREQLLQSYRHLLLEFPCNACLFDAKFLEQSTTVLYNINDKTCCQSMSYFFQLYCTG